MSKEKLKKIKKIFKNNNKKNYYFISATSFNLINIHRWVKNWKNLNTIDCFSGLSPSTIRPLMSGDEAFNSTEEVNEFILSDDKIVNLIKEDNKNSNNAIFLFFNENIEKKCKEIGLDILLPSSQLVREIDNKIITTEIGNSAGVRSVDNVLSKINNYRELMTISQEHNLSNQLVIQKPYGDSGKTTYFINNESDYNLYADKIQSEDLVKIMRKINCIGSAIEACATKEGTYVGPLLGEIIGDLNLTPYSGGWCGNELYQEQFSHKIREDIHLKTEKIGQELYKRGYKGYFEADFLIDLNTETIYLGEINPRITGISAMTNTSPFCISTIPLFLFHLMEYEGYPFDILPHEYNNLSLKEGAAGVSSQLVAKSTDEKMRVVVKSPSSGLYQLTKNNELIFIKASTDPTDKGSDTSSAYLLKIIQDGEYCYKGADLFILFLNEKITKKNSSTLNKRGLLWFQKVSKLFIKRKLSKDELLQVSFYNSPTSTKGAST